MEKSEADSVLCEVFNACEDMLLTCFYIVVKQGDPHFALGYAITIKDFLPNIHKQQVLSIAQKHGLAVREEKNELIIYKPKLK